jgi:arginyl-tRNA synthetase
MKTQLESLLAAALATLKADGTLPADFQPAIQLDRTKDKAHGDWATNLALASAKAAGKKPRDVAGQLLAALPANDTIAKVEIAGPGFINFFLQAGSRFEVLGRILNEGASFMRPDAGKGAKILLEYVSANPTGPMHVGHGRGAAYGSALANILTATGHDVTTEYYINDAGRQADVLAVSVFLRYLEACGESVRIPSRAYPGDYVRVCGENLKNAEGRRFFHTYTSVMGGVLPDSDEDGDAAKAIKEAHLDSLIARVQELLGPDYREVQDFGLNEQLTAIRATLQQFNVSFDRWFSERTLADSGAIDKAVVRLRDRGHVYEKDGAVWLATEKLGDDKDRVLIRDNGIHTYFAADVAYHLDKLDRGFDTLIDVWGADHHGYIPRVRAAIEALTGQGDKFHVALIQFVTLSSGKMGKRSGNFVTLKDLIDEAGGDATRFFYLTRSPEQHLEFDIDLARSQSSENPVYYLQYAHARVCSMLEKLGEHGWTFDQAQGLANTDKLTVDAEIALAKKLASYPEVLQKAAKNEAPQQLTTFLRELAADFHGYYNSNKMLIDDAALRNARLTLSVAVRTVIANGLQLLGVSAPERM